MSGLAVSGDMVYAAPWMSEAIIMTELNTADFAEFFTALWDKPPFAWQKDLAKSVLEKTLISVQDSSAPDFSLPQNGARSPWPEAIALPTASGKTACLDIAIFALAAQASRLGRKQTMTAPRRIFFVVDRRVIVDEAYERARRLAEKLENATGDILKRVADNLRRIARGENDGFHGERPLSVHILRGGMYRSEAWARNPLQPMVVASTVDQVGSRLLFRAYGRGPGTWPIYAGLIANDSLILLDEAHCAQPFFQTLQAVRRFQTWAHVPLRRCFQPVVMSATPPPGMVDVFKDQSDENRDPAHPLGRRQLAEKPAVLKIIAMGKKAADVLAGALAEDALRLINDKRRAIVVFVNRVATARKTHCLLSAREDLDAILLTGRMRPVDKDAVVKQHLEPLKSGQSDNRSLSKPVIVVATQTLEVGADLDFDGLVTECASLDALRQRFGRLNRMGRPIEARAVILVRGDQVGPTEDKQDDPVYGQSLAKTWTWLNKHKDKKGEIDFGIVHLDRLISQNDSLVALNAPSLDAPVMLPAHVDCWAQTAPEPQPSPDVVPFLHGPREGAADVQACWRADLDLTTQESQDHALESLSLCPPSSSEMLPVPISVFRRWLAGNDVEDDSADVEGSWTETDTESHGSSSAGLHVIRWRGAQIKREDILSSPAEIRPGDVVVIPVNHPCSWQQLGDIPSEASKPVAALDVGDQAYRRARAKPILRLHPDLVEAWPDFVTAKGRALDLLKGLKRKYEDEPDEVTDALQELLRELSDSPEPWLSSTARELRQEFPGSKLGHAYHIVGGNSLILVGRRRIQELTTEVDSFSDEDDVSASGISHSNGQPVPLRRHLPGVEAFARRHAVGCGLPDDLGEAIARAGLLHDLGKADPRFQSLLRGGGRFWSTEPLAKSAAMPKTRAAYHHARKASGYPEGGRHELLSVRLAESVPALLPEGDDLRDLTLHLIASHHGYCRPFAPVVFDEPSVTVDFELCGQQMHWSGPTGLERLDSGVADRYWRLVRRYGWWGLAWLEALLRLADWRRSEWEETHNDNE